jgi:hypothetical protein
MNRALLARQVRAPNPQHEQILVSPKYSSFVGTLVHGYRSKRESPPTRIGANTMSQHVIKTLILTAGLAAIPALGNAAKAPVAMDNCVKAFVESLSKHTPALKLRDSRYFDDAPSEGQLSELKLIATDVHDKHTVGRAICRVDLHGEVVSLQERTGNSWSLEQ